jgi:mannosyltransferase
MEPGLDSAKVKCFFAWFSQPRRVLFWFVLLGALVLRLYKLNAYSIWLDEAWQYGSSDHPWDRLHSSTVPVDQMFLSLLVTHLHIVTHFDADAWQLRMSPAIFGVAAIGVIFLFVREAFEERIAWIAACLGACWPRLVQYSQEMRAYSLFVLLAAVAAFSLHKALRTNLVRYWALFSIAVVLELYNHFIAATNAIAWALFAAGWILFEIVRGYVTGGPAGQRSGYVRLGLAAAAGAAMALALVPALPLYLRFQEFVSRQGYLGRSPLVLNADTLRKIFGNAIGLGDNASVCVIGGLALIGFAYACCRFPRGAVLCLLWIGLPIALAMARNSGEGLLFSTRYMQFVTPAYLALIATGILALAAGIRGQLAARVSLQNASRFALVVRLGLTATLIALTARPLWGLYSHDPKEVPVDLRSAYGYVLSRATANDVVIGFGDIAFWHSGWFRVIDPYYLRNSSVVQEVITMGSMNYAAIPFRHIDHATGKLFAMVPSRPELQSKIREIAADQYNATCWDHICVLESHGQRPVSELFDDFCARYQFMDPIGLANVRPNVKVERVESSSLVAEPIPADLNLEALNESVVRDANGKIQARAIDGLTLWGWALWEKSVAGGVQIKIDDQVFKASYGALRPDVAFYFDNPALKPSGFVFRLPAHLLSTGDHVLKVQVLNPERTAFRSSATYSFTIAP